MDTRFDALQVNNDLPLDLTKFASNLGRSDKRDLLMGCTPLIVVPVTAVVVAVVVSVATEVIWIVTGLEDLCR
jgi:hypothetical protein